MWPDANIGGALGSKAGRFALDVDPRNGGADTLAALTAQYGDLPPTLTALTGGIGHHYLLKWPSSYTGKLKGSLGPGLDVKAEGGLIVLAPSLHASSNRYRWLNDASVAEAPAWLLDKLSEAKPAGFASADVGEAILEGSRNNTLTSLGGTMRWRGMSAEEIAAALLVTNERRCKPPLASDEVQKIALSVSKYPAAQQSDAHQSARVVASPTVAALSSPAYEAKADTLKPNAEAEKSAKPKTPDEIEWLSPIPFDEYRLPTFPIEAFPVWLRNYFGTLAVATQTPVDAPATLVISVISAAVARCYRIVVRGRWSEPLNTYVVVILPPANRKSAIHDDVTRPLAEYEKDLIERERDSIARERTEYKILEARVERLRKDCAKAKADAFKKLKAEAEDAAAELAEKNCPVEAQLICDDVTPETLATLLAEQGGRIANFSAEGGIFEIMGGRYSKGSNLEVFLKGHAGDTLRVNRRGRAEHIQKPALTIGLTVQPEVIRGLARRPEFRGKGLLGRFFYSIPPSMIGRRDVSPQDVPARIEQTYAEKIRALANLAPVKQDEPRLIRLSPTALQSLTAYAKKCESEMREGGNLSEITDWAGKLVGGVARIAGLLHLAEHVGRNIPELVGQETIEAACRIGDYFTAHARAAFAELGASPAVEDAKYVLRWFRRELPHREEKLIYRKREILRGCQTRFKTADELDPVLNLLISHDYLKALDTSDDYIDRSRRGRRPSAKFALNPFFVPAQTNDTNDEIQDDEANLSFLSFNPEEEEIEYSPIDQIAALTVGAREEIEI